VRKREHSYRLCNERRGGEGKNGKDESKGQNRFRSSLGGSVDERSGEKEKGKQKAGRIWERSVG